MIGRYRYSREMKGGKDEHLHPTVDLTCCIYHRARRCGLLKKTKPPVKEHKHKFAHEIDGNRTNICGLEHSFFSIGERGTVLSREYWFPVTIVHVRDCSTIHSQLVSRKRKRLNIRRSMTNGCNYFTSVICLRALSKKGDGNSALIATYLCCDRNIGRIIRKIEHGTVSSRVEDSIVLGRVYFRQRKSGC